MTCGSCGWVSSISASRWQVAEELNEACPGLGGFQVCRSSEGDSPGELLVIANAGEDPKKSCLKAEIYWMGMDFYWICKMMYIQILCVGMCLSLELTCFGGWMEDLWLLCMWHHNNWGRGKRGEVIGMGPLFNIKWSSSGHRHFYQHFLLYLPLSSVHFNIFSIRQGREFESKPDL